MINNIFDVFYQQQKVISKLLNGQIVLNHVYFIASYWYHSTQHSFGENAGSDLSYYIFASVIEYKIKLKWCPIR